MTKMTSLFLAGSLLFSLSACTVEEESNDPMDTPMDDPVVDETIVGTAEAAGDFTTLLAAVDAAGLTETLQGDGPFTVFAPTDAAFAALPEGTVEALLNDVPTLTDILLYHVVAGDIGSSEVVQESLVTTVGGIDFKVVVDDGNVFINDARVTVTDIAASNGTIHVIDTVLLPPPSIAEIAAADGRFETLVAALSAANLVDTLAGDGPFTVFAPTDDAFAKLPEGTVEALLDDIPALTDILLYHVADVRLPAEDVVAADEVNTLHGSTVDVSIEDGAVMLDAAQVVITDIPAENGIIHVIDAVLIPE